MKWNALTNINQIDTLKELSAKQAVLIFKHSTRCSISSAALNRLERNWQGNEPINLWFLDLIKYRDVSNAVAQQFQIEHQSPQVLVIKNGQCIYHSSHFDIDYHDILAHAR
jgi:bacillithiol system protein YtxJ